MKLEVGSAYKIVVEVNNSILTFSCKIISADDNFVTFTDKFDKTYTYNLKNIISFELVKEEGEHTAWR